MAASSRVTTNSAHYHSEKQRTRSFHLLRRVGNDVNNSVQTVSGSLLCVLCECVVTTSPVWILPWVLWEAAAEPPVVTAEQSWSHLPGLSTGNKSISEQEPLRQNTSLYKDQNLYSDQTDILPLNTEYKESLNQVPIKLSEYSNSRYSSNFVLEVW